MKVSAAPQARRSHASPAPSGTLAPRSWAPGAEYASTSQPAPEGDPARPHPRGHDFGTVDVFPASAGPQPVIQRFPGLESARRHWLPTWAGGYSASEVRRKENREATVRKIKAEQAKAQQVNVPQANVPQGKANAKKNAWGYGLNLIAEPDLSGNSSVGDVLTDMATRTTGGATRVVRKAATHLYKVGDESNYLKLGSAEGQVMATPGANSRGEVGLGRMKGNASLVDARLGSKNLYVRGQLGGLESNVKGQYPPAVTSRAYYAGGEIGASANVLGFNPYLKVSGSVGHDLQAPLSMPYKDKSGIRLPMGSWGDLKFKVAAGLNWSKQEKEKEKNG